jgi:hypothetical protein
MTRKVIEDVVYEYELDRMSQLAKFPAVPVVRQEMIRTLRHITEVDRDFLHALVSYFVDHGKTCPLPRELREQAGKMRYAAAKPLGGEDCPKCHGTGFYHTTKRVQIPGLEPYDAECSEPCRCLGLPVGVSIVQDSRENRE